jgi:hypothetical protein
MRMHLLSYAGVFAVTVLLHAAPVAGAAECTGECGQVTVDEIIQLVNLALGNCPPTPTPAPTPTPTTASTVYVYWDSDEEQDAQLPTGELRLLVPPWDPNGQMCIFPPGFGPAGGGGFVTGYNPTVPGQHNAGSLKPLKNPPIGVAMYDRNGTYVKPIYVPGPYAIPGSDSPSGAPYVLGTFGGDIPPSGMSKACTDGVTASCDTDADCPNGSKCYGNFNDNGSFTGCAFDTQGHLFGADIGGAQGALASPDQGRIIEWFPPDYQSYCIIFGPTQGGFGPPHYVDGTGGLKNPGTMAVDPAGNLYVTETGARRVLRFDHASLPQSAEECGPDGLRQTTPTVFIHNVDTPAGIARDPSCSTDTSNCWAVTSIIGGNSVNWFDDVGNLTTVKGPVPPGAFNPFGIAVSPNGDVFFVDIALKCGADGCGTQGGKGGVFKVSFTNGTPSTPQRLAGGLSFPTSVTLCDASQQTCPLPLFELIGTGPG